MTPNPSDTPRTDAWESEAEDATTYCIDGWKRARTLERELASMTAERDALRSDAERYRILRRFDLVSLHHATQTFEGISNLDAFCDAAMSEEGG